MCPTGFHTAALVQHNCFAAFARTKTVFYARSFIIASVLSKVKGKFAKNRVFTRLLRISPLMHDTVQKYFSSYYNLTRLFSDIFCFSLKRTVPEGRTRITPLRLLLALCIAPEVTRFLFGTPFAPGKHADIADVKVLKVCLVVVDVKLLLSRQLFRMFCNQAFCPSVAGYPGPPRT